MTLEFLAHVFAEFPGRPFHRRQNFVHRFPRRGTRGGDHGVALVGIHEHGSFEQMLLFAKWDGQEAMFVGVNELARLDLTAVHLDFVSPTHGRRMRVAHAQTPGQGFESGVVHFVQIADGPVGNCAHAAEGAVNVRVDFAPERADHVGLVEILHDDDFGCRVRRRRSVGTRSIASRGLLCAALLGSMTTVTA